MTDILISFLYAYKGLDNDEGQISICVKIFLPNLTHEKISSLYISTNIKTCSPKKTEMVENI